MRIVLRRKFPLETGIELLGQENERLVDHKDLASPSLAEQTIWILQSELLCMDDELDSYCWRDGTLAVKENKPSNGQMRRGGLYLEPRSSALT